MRVAVLRADRACDKLGVYVISDAVIYVRRLKAARFYHAVGAAVCFLCRLEYEFYRGCEKLSDFRI